MYVTIAHWSWTLEWLLNLKESLSPFEKYIIPEAFVLINMVYDHKIVSVPEHFLGSHCSRSHMASGQGNFMADELDISEASAPPSLSSATDIQ